MLTWSRSLANIKSRPRNKNQAWYPEMSKFSTKRSSFSYSRATSLILSDCERFFYLFSIKTAAPIEHEIKEENDKAPAVSFTTVYNFYAMRYFTVFRFQWSLACFWEVVRFPVTLSATCILLLSFTELNSFTFLSNVLPFPQTNAFDLKRNLTWRFWKPTDKLWRDWHMTEWQILPIPARFPHVAKNIWRIINTIASIWL